jgi:hypothetical protein
MNNMFKELSELGYRHYTENTIEELDELPFDSEERIIEQALVLKWFRDVHGYYVSIRKRYFDNGAEVEYNYFIYPPNSNEHLEHNLLDEYDSWEEAESSCIDDLIKLVKFNGRIDFICPDSDCPHCNYEE